MTTIPEALAALSPLAEHVEVTLSGIEPQEAVAAVPCATWSAVGTAVHPWIEGRVGNVTVTAFPRLEDPRALGACLGAVEAARQMSEVSA